MAFQIGTVTTSGFSMDYIRFGSGKDILVILPGLSVQSVIPSAGAIAQAYQDMTPYYTVYLFDRRKELPQTYPIEQMAQDTHDAMQALQLQKVHLFGASQGGMIAMMIAGLYPSMVEKLILGSTACRITAAQYETVSRWVDTAKAGDTQALYLLFGEAIYPESLFKKYQRALCILSKSVSQKDLQRFIILAQAMQDFDGSKTVQTITCPVLILSAKDDHVLGDSAGPYLKEQLIGTTAVEAFAYQGYGHAAYDTAPDYHTRMLQFLRK